MMHDPELLVRTTHVRDRNENVYIKPVCVTASGFAVCVWGCPQHVDMPIEAYTLSIEHNLVQFNERST